MLRHLTVGLLTIVLATACSSTSTLRPSVPPAASATPDASAIPTGAVGLPSGTPGPSPAPGGSPLPDAPAGYAWVGLREERGPTGDPVATRVLAGLLGSPATIVMTVPRADGFVRAWSAADLVALAIQRDRAITFEVRRVGDGASLATWKLTSPEIRQLQLDPARGFAYVLVSLPAGGQEIRRLAIADATSTTLISLDKRFTPDSIPTDRADIALDGDGTLLVDACTADDGCRLWQVPSGDPAPEPIVLKKGTPLLCSIVGAAPTWLVVYDTDACFADTGEASLPIRAISRSDGSSHLVDTGHVMAKRVLEFEGGTYVVGSVRSSDWSTSDIVAIDVGSRTTTTHARGLENPGDGLGGWLGVSPLVLPGAWILVEPWGVDAFLETEQALPHARLLDLSTDGLTELAPGTFGWS